MDRMPFRQLAEMRFIHLATLLHLHASFRPALPMLFPSLLLTSHTYLPSRCRYSLHATIHVTDYGGIKCKE